MLCLKKAALVLFAFFLGFQSYAQEEEAPTPVTPKDPKEITPANSSKTLGWNRSANLGLNLSFSSSQDVVGQTDGNSETYGLNLKSSFNYKATDSEWRNTITLLENITKTPTIPRYVKSNDELRIESLYLYSIPKYPKIGPYVRGEAFTPIFKGEDVRPTPETYEIQDPSGNVVSGPFASDTVRLTDGFRPLTTKESAGFFWKAKEEENLNILVRVGLGAVQVKADGQYALIGTDDTTGNIVVRELEDVNQAGLEMGLSVKGRFDEKTSYELGAETLTPFINNRAEGDNRDAIRLTNIDSFAKLTSNITSWAAFSYDYRMKLQPQLIDRVQSVHMVVLSINYNLF